MNLTHKIISAHLKSGNLIPGEEIALRMDQTLTQDATGTMAWLQFEALGVERVRTDLSVSYVDHNTLQTGFRNADDHRFLRTTAAKFGAVFSPAGTGICHQLHLENFAKPGATLLGSDSHTPTAGGMGALAMGAGGLSVALAMAGIPYALPMPKVLQIRLTGQLSGWATAKDIILHLLQKLTVKGGVGKILEFTGPGVATLSVPDRATITNMGAELGATTSIFPSDEVTREFLKRQGREQDWKPLAPDADATYDETLDVNLCAIVPMAACPHSPDAVATVASLTGTRVDQVLMGSCTNSSYADLEQAAQVLGGKRVHEAIECAVSPGSKQVLAMLADNGSLERLLLAGVRLLECACGPCIGMGGSPSSGGVSVRTFNRNFEGRSGTKDAQCYLVSPLVAAQAALNGGFTEPVTWGTAPARADLPVSVPSIRHLFVVPPASGKGVDILRGPNIAALETFPPLEDTLSGSVVIKLEDNISTDHIMPAGTDITALRSNVPAIAEYVFSRVDPHFAARARQTPNGIIIARENYGQGSSREHAALAPRHLGVRAVIACSLARIHRANLINFGILPLTFTHPEDYAKLAQGNVIHINTTDIKPGEDLKIRVDGLGDIPVHNDLSAAELQSIRAGGLLNEAKTFQD